MIIPTRDAKSYGAVHIDHYLTFTGFCKKVYSDEIQSIDVLIDGQKIDTITCDKTIDKVSKIYDIDGYGFEYDLPEIYFDRRHILSFRCSDSGEELVNSPISTIARDDEKFNEYKFLHSLSKPIDEDKIKDMYCPNSIGFLATEENLADEEFVGYIKELMVRFPDVEFKGFCLNTKEMNKLKELFNNSINIKHISTIQELINKTKIFVYPPNLNIPNTIVGHISNFTIYTRLDFSIKDSIKDYEERFKGYFSVFFNNIEKFGFTQENIIEYDNSFLCLVYNYFIKLHKLNCKFINSNDSYQTIYFKKVELIVSSNDFQGYLRKITNLLNQLNKNN
ncbi:MAG: hypothetical protein M0P43_06845 [Arcobacteraceae bacterium]|nr:hypothetical protein [Arcobacteraceae bacterium]MDY0327530.1 hypothetical protein [Arcobacteraceae bacterium]